jgi:hypothetical protein
MKRRPVKYAGANARSRGRTFVHTAFTKRQEYVQLRQPAVTPATPTTLSNVRHCQFKRGTPIPSVALLTQSTEVSTGCIAI